MAEWNVLLEEQMRYGRKIPIRDLHSADADAAGDIGYGGHDGHTDGPLVTIPSICLAN